MSHTISSNLCQAKPRMHAQVVDAPRFEWRGFMLDVGRHFFSVPFILRMLDVAAFYRLNRFHWHLTEDQVGIVGLVLLVFCSSGRKEAAYLSASMTAGHIVMAVQNQLDNKPSCLSTGSRLGTGPDACQ